MSDVDYCPTSTDIKKENQMNTINVKEYLQILVQYFNGVVIFQRPKYSGYSFLRQKTSLIQIITESVPCILAGTKRVESPQK